MPSPRQIVIGPKIVKTYLIARLISFIGLIQSQIDYMACSVWVNVDPGDVLGKSYFHVSSPSMQTKPRDSSEIRLPCTRVHLHTFWPDTHLLWWRCETPGNSSNQLPIPNNLGLDTKIRSLAILEPKLWDTATSITGQSAQFPARYPFHLVKVWDVWK